MNVHRATRIAAVAVASVLVALAGAPAGASEPPQGGRPDLVILKDRIRKSVSFRKINVRAGDCSVVEGCVSGLGKRRILEFDTYVVNRGTADLVLGRPEDRPNLYEYSPCHGHYHLKASFVYGLTKGGTDTAAVYSSATRTVYARDENSAGPAAPIFTFPATGPGDVPPTETPIAGDWDGDGTVTPGMYDSATSTFTLTNLDNAEPIVFTFRVDARGLRPVAGDWDGDGTDTVGLYSHTNGNAYLKRKNSRKRKHDVVPVGARDADRWLPIAGDWDGDDRDTLGFFDREAGRFELKNANAPDLSFAFGPAGPGSQPLAGDWNRDGVDTVGVYDVETGLFAIRDESSEGEPSAVFSLDPGGEGPFVPLAGDWDYEFGELVVPGKKEAFCWIDTQRVTGDRTMQFFECNERQGLTVGWADIYIRGTDCQWIDITDLPAGVYQLAIAVNDEGLIPESDLTNNTAIVKVRIPEPRRKAPEVRVTSHARSGAKLEPGEPVTVRWKVRNGASVTRQELWLADVHDGHPSKVLLLDDEIPPGARSYTWVPTEEFASSSAQFIVRAQDDEHFLGHDARSKGTFAVGDGHHHEAKRCR